MINVGLAQARPQLVQHKRKVPLKQKSLSDKFVMRGQTINHGSLLVLKQVLIHSQQHTKTLKSIALLIKHSKQQNKTS